MVVILERHDASEAMKPNTNFLLPIALIAVSAISIAQELPDNAEPVLDQVVPVADEPSTNEEAAASPVGEQGDVDSADDELSEIFIGERVGPEREDPETSGLTERELLVMEFDRFRQLKEDGMLDEAENSAKRAIEMSISTSGPGSNDTAKALTNLASVQYEITDYESAMQNFQSAIEIFKDNEDQLSERLINPLKGLGAAQLESGRPDLAAETFGQAVHVSHVNEGPHNIDQVPLLEALAETRLRLGNLDGAKDAQDMIYALNIRHLDEDAMALVPTLMRRAAWQRRTGYILDERATYRRIIRIIETEHGKDTIDLIEPLTELAQSYFYVDNTDAPSFQASSIATGEIYLKRAVRIAEESPESDWQMLARTQLALADYYNFRSDIGRARRNYRDVWDLLSEDPERLTVRHDLLETLHALNVDPLPIYAGDATREDRQRADSDVRQGSIVVAYEVSDRGRVSDVDVVESNPPEFEDMEDRVVREVRQRIFRPRFADGEPVDTGDQVLAHRFYYQQAELEAMRAATAPQ